VPCLSNKLEDDEESDRSRKRNDGPSWTPLAEQRRDGNGFHPEQMSTWNKQNQLRKEGHKVNEKKKKRAKRTDALIEKTDQVNVFHNGPTLE
jgi:hypothetical protein